MDCYTSSYLIGTMHYVYALTHKDKQWQNVGGGMNQAHAAEVTHKEEMIFYMYNISTITSQA